MYAAIRDFLRAEYGGVECVGRLGFENAYALAMRRDRADRLGVRSIADLKSHAPQLRLASDFQFLSRPEWFTVRDTYGLAFRESRGMDPGLMYDAVKAGEADVITAYTSDGRIDAYDLVLLADPARAIPSYDAVLLVSPRAAGRPGLLDALRPLVGAIDVAAMRRANYRVDVDAVAVPRAAAGLWEAAARRR
jgi:osmoprotectant transport system permease protein